MNWNTGDFMIVPRILSHLKHSRNRCAVMLLTAFLVLLNVLLAACSTSFGGSTSSPTATATPSDVPIAQLHWCGKKSMLFRDEGAATPTTTATSTPGVTATASVTPGVTATSSAVITPTTTVTVAPGTPTTITDWSQVEAGLGFVVYLPATLPAGTCLVNAQATIHDPIIVGSFTIGYLLPDHSALSLAEAPLISQNTIFQCNTSNGSTPKANSTPKSGTPVVSPNATQVAPLLLCSGAKGMTNIVMSARGTTDHLQQIFNNLQPNVTWIPGA
jgi:hypothetical protein